MKFHEIRPFGVALLQGDGRTDTHTHKLSSLIVSFRERYVGEPK